MEFSTCPVCSLTVPSLELQRHANDHFADEDYARDFHLAQEIALFPPSPPRMAEDSLKCTTSYCDHTPQSNYDEKYAFLVRSQIKETFYEVEGGLINLLAKCLELEPGNSMSILSGHVDHFQSVEFEDVGWGCGWRNIQMLSSHLLRQRVEAKEVIYGGCGFVPDIGSLQRWLELAWGKGFDAPGSYDFDREIYGKRNWIGTTECASIFRLFGLHARIVDFCSKESELPSSVPHLGLGIRDESVHKRNISHVYGPMDVFLSKGKLDLSLTISSNNESRRLTSGPSEKVKDHHALNEWVWKYFSGNSVCRLGNCRVVLSEKAPLYFQHDGHSRTIVGIQAKRQMNGMQHYNLLIFDPSVKTRSLEKSLRENAGWQKLIKRGAHTLRKPQYQLCFIDLGVARGEELEQLKTLRSICHEF